jgi:hypothetical protein
MDHAWSRGPEAEERAIPKSRVHVRVTVQALDSLVVQLHVGSIIYCEPIIAAAAHGCKCYCPRLTYAYTRVYFVLAFGSWHDQSVCLDQMHWTPLAFPAECLCIWLGSTCRIIQSLPKDTEFRLCPGTRWWLRIPGDIIVNPVATKWNEPRKTLFMKEVEHKFWIPVKYLVRYIPDRWQRKLTTVKSVHLCAAHSSSSTG